MQCIPLAGVKNIVQRSLKARCAVALAVQVADELFCQRGSGVPPGNGIAPHAQSTYILHHVQQKGSGSIPLPVKPGLPVGVRIGVEPRVAALTREAEGQPALGKPRQRQTAAVVKVSPRRRQAEDRFALRRRPHGVLRVRAEPVQPADHRRKPQQQRPVQRKHSPA